MKHSKDHIVAIVSGLLAGGGFVNRHPTEDWPFIKVIDHGENWKARGARERRELSVVSAAMDILDAIIPTGVGVFEENKSIDPSKEP